MKFIIEKVENGLILKYKEEEKVITHIFEENEDSNLKSYISLVNTLSFLIGVDGDRYSNERFFAGALPGDKNENSERTELVKETLERVSWYFNEN